MSNFFALITDRHVYYYRQVYYCSVKIKLDKYIYLYWFVATYGNYIWWSQAIRTYFLHGINSTKKNSDELNYF